MHKGTPCARLSSSVHEEQEPGPALRLAASERRQNQLTEDSKAIAAAVGRQPRPQGLFKIEKGVSGRQPLLCQTQRQWPGPTVRCRTQWQSSERRQQ